jgi:hypothetical protein
MESGGGGRGGGGQDLESDQMVWILGPDELSSGLPTSCAIMFTTIGSKLRIQGTQSLSDITE